MARKSTAKTATRTTASSQKRGASRVAPKRAARARWPVLPIFGLILAALGIGAGVAALDPLGRLRAVTERPITAVEIESDYRYLSRDSVEQMVRGFAAEGFVNLDLVSLQQALEADPWIARAAIARRWPDKLHIVIEEEQPIARWGDKGFLNMRGEIIDADTPADLAALPTIHGPSRHAAELLAQYLALNKVVAGTDLIVREFRRDAANNVELALANGVQIKLGNQEALPKLRLLARARQGALAQRFAEIATIDMRYEQGFAVSWRDTPSGS